MERYEAYWKQSQPLSEDYLHQFSRVGSLYEYNPWDEQSWYTRADCLDQDEALSADREQLTQALLAYNRRANAPAAVIESIEKLKDERALTIVGGQQAGLFSGPIYVIYKAVTIIQRAREAERRLNRPVVPVFWIAGEDHDFDEVNHMHFQSKDPSVEQIKLDHPTGKRSPVSQVLIDEAQWETVLRQLDESLIPTEYKQGIIEQLSSISKVSQTLSDFFARMMCWLFGAYGLVLVDANDPNIRKLETPFFNRIIERNQGINHAVVQAKLQVESMNYSSQLEVGEDDANLFVIEDGERHLLKRDGDAFSDKKGGRRYSKEELLHLSHDAPEQLSNNVVTRPLMQEYLFPVLETVLGPGEIAYWALLKEAFHAVSMKMPICTARYEYSLIDSTVQKYMDRYNLELNDVIERIAERRQTWLNQQDEYHFAEKFQEVTRSFKEMYTPILEDVVKVNPGMKNLCESNVDKLLQQIDFMKYRAQGAVELKHDASLRQWDYIYLSVTPMDKRQERVYNVVAYINKYGFDWIGKLIESPVESGEKHQFIYF